jgi:hypothetical protein
VRRQAMANGSANRPAIFLFFEPRPKVLVIKKAESDKKLLQKYPENAK